MIYNEYAQVLEATNPATGELYKPEDLNVFNWNDYRSSMLQDAIFAREAWLNEGTNRDVAVRFVRASLKGWMYCRDNPADCVQYTLDAGSQLGAGHQAWMMNEINALVWPSPGGVGVLDPIGWNQTVQVAKGAGIIKQDPSTTRLRHLDRRRGPHGHRGRHQGCRLHQGRPSRSPPAATRARSDPQQHRRPVPRGAGRSDSGLGRRPRSPGRSVEASAARGGEPRPPFGARDEHDRRDARLGQGQRSLDPARRRRRARSSPGTGRSTR